MITLGRKQAEAELAYYIKLLLEAENSVNTYTKCVRDKRYVLQTVYGLTNFEVEQLHAKIVEELTGSDA